MQHFLNFLPLPHGQGSFRPTFTFAEPGGGAWAAKCRLLQWA
jgi:hypothetical protein